jgi:hypothetical protein
MVITPIGSRRKEWFTAGGGGIDGPSVIHTDLDELTLGYWSESSVNGACIVAPHMGHGYNYRVIDAHEIATDSWDWTLSADELEKTMIERYKLNTISGIIVVPTMAVAVALELPVLWIGAPSQGAFERATLEMDDSQRAIVSKWYSTIINVHNGPISSFTAELVRARERRSMSMARFREVANLINACKRFLRAQTSSNVLLMPLPSLERGHVQNFDGLRTIIVLPDINEAMSEAAGLTDPQRTRANIEIQHEQFRRYAEHAHVPVYSSIADAFERIGGRPARQKKIVGNIETAAMRQITRAGVQTGASNETLSEWERDFQDNFVMKQLNDERRENLKILQRWLVAPGDRLTVVVFPGPALSRGYSTSLIAEAMESGLDVVAERFNEKAVLRLSSINLIKTRKPNPDETIEGIRSKATRMYKRSYGVPDGTLRRVLISTRPVNVSDSPARLMGTGETAEDAAAIGALPAGTAARAGLDENPVLKADTL